MEKGIDDELKRLADDRFLFPSDVEKMDKGKLRCFFESGLAKKMLSSKRIFREKRFMIRYPASLFTEKDKELLKDETLLVQGVIDCALPLVYTGVLSSGVAFTLQILGQQHLSPAPASLIMSLESVFAVLAGWVLLHQTLRPIEALGCALVFLAVILSQSKAN